VKFFLVRLLISDLVREATNNQFYQIYSMLVSSIKFLFESIDRTCELILPFISHDCPEGNDFEDGFSHDNENSFEFVDAPDAFIDVAGSLAINHEKNSVDAADRSDEKQNISGFKAQIIMSYCWRAAKEASALLSELLQFCMARVFCN
jgi:hypothetical protein